MRQGREADHLPPRSAQVKNAWSRSQVPRTRVYPKVSGLAAAWSENCK